MVKITTTVHRSSGGNYSFAYAMPASEANKVITEMSEAMQYTKPLAPRIVCTVESMPAGWVNPGVKVAL